MKVNEIIKNDKYDALTGICSIFAFMFRLLVYKTRLSKSSLSLSLRIFIGGCIDFSSWPIFLRTSHAIVSLRDCLKFTTTRLKQDTTHRARTQEAFHVNCTPAGGCSKAIIDTPARQKRFIINKETPTA